VAPAGTCGRGRAGLARCSRMRRRRAVAREVAPDDDQRSPRLGRSDPLGCGPARHYTSQALAAPAASNPGVGQQSGVPLAPIGRDRSTGRQSGVVPARDAISLELLRGLGADAEPAPTPDSGRRAIDRPQTRLPWERGVVRVSCSYRRTGAEADPGLSGGDEFKAAESATSQSEVNTSSAAADRSGARHRA
jgi:hypothetical protein